MVNLQNKRGHLKMWKENKGTIEKKNLTSRDLVQLGKKIKDQFANNI